MTQQELLQLINRATAEGWTSLNLLGNFLTELPAEIGQLSSLTSLNLSYNLLTELPTEISQLSSLTSLDLLGNWLTELPGEISQLSSLTSLYLSHNSLTELPGEISQLSSLTSLYLSHNSLTELPAEIGQLSSLTSLNLSYNLLTELPAEISQLSSLTSLDLLGNSLTELPVEISHLLDLASLNLSHNSLTELPTEIGQLSSLLLLYLSGNKLERLTVSLKQLKKLEELYLEGNTALSLSPEVLTQSRNPAFILKTYFGARRPLQEAKMLLVGQGGVGKTALARRLLYNLPPSEEYGKTEGVDILKWPVGEITLNLWDFGGQGVYQATHQFFFTKRSLYLVVINARTGEQESRLHHWLKLVASLSNNAPAIVVVNKQDEHPLQLDERELKQKYPNLLAIVPTSCTTGAGINKLRQAITDALNHLPHIYDLFPIDWFSLKERLERMSSNYITYERYQEYCNTAGIEHRDDQRSWVQILHELGVVLNYQDRHLQGTHVLKPEWVTDGVYRILSDPAREIASNNGILTGAMLDTILDSATYPRHQQQFIVGMMTKFELGFPIPQRPDHYLIPDLLPKQQPEVAIDFSTAIPTLRFQIHYSDFLPSSILSRFMVGMMAMLDRQASWQQGAMLVFDNNRALVQADLETRQIFIAVSGSIATRRSLLNSIRMQFHVIHVSFPNLPLTEHIPIPEHPNKTIGYRALCNLERRGITHYYDPMNDVDLDVQALLAGIETVDLRQERQLQENLMERYNLEEIRQLCFDLRGVNYDNLPGETLGAKTRELVQFMGRNGRLDELAQHLRR